MPAIIYKTDQEARQALLSGVAQLAKLVTTTLGPKGRNIALDRLWSAPAVIHDGVSIAKEIEFKDPFENMGAMLVKEAAAKTADRAGDGTTTSTLLAWKLIEKGMRLVEQGSNPMMMREGLDKATAAITEYLTNHAKPVKDQDLDHVATISAASEEIGKTIADAIRHVGADGVVTVEEGMGQETTIEYKDGMMFDKGFASGSPIFVTDKDNQIVEILNPMILYTDLTIDSQQDFTDFLDNVLTEHDRNIVIVADSFQGYTLPMLIDNHQRGNIRAFAVQAPSFGLKRIWMLEDMAALTGGTVITRQSGRTLASIKKEELGRADKVWADADNTKIIGGHGSKEAIAERVNSLKQQLEKEESDFEKKGIRERIARLTGGAAIIKVGALTETELKDRKERVIDAVEATKSAVAEGIIAGGGIALLQCQNSLRHLSDQEPDPDVSEGIKLVIDVLDQPLRKILQNAGRTPEVIIEKIEQEDTEGYGYDIVANKYGNMFEMGVIDPVKVTRQAIQNAASVAAMILTTDGLITRHPEEKLSPLEKNAPLL